MTDFEREDRYIVVKRRDLGSRAGVLTNFLRWCMSVRTIQCVVVEHDWPEYEPVWEMIRQRCEGATLSPPLPSTEEPVAWRWRYVHPGQVGHWKVRQTPVEPHAATPGYAALEVEPLYALAAPLPSTGVERVREALDVLSVSSEEHSRVLSEAASWRARAEQAEAALSALPLDGGLK